MSAQAPKGDPDGSVDPRRRFPRSARLLRHADFERVYKQGRRHFSASMTVFYLSRKALEAAGRESISGMRVGFTVGRVLGGAVQRNRMKRRLREAVRLCRPLSMPDVDVVINPKKSLLRVEFSALQNEITRAFVVIEQKLGIGGTNLKLEQSPESREPKAGSRS